MSVTHSSSLIHLQSCSVEISSSIGESILNESNSYRALFSLSPNYLKCYAISLNDVNIVLLATVDTAYSHSAVVENKLTSNSDFRRQRSSTEWSIDYTIFSVN